MSALLTLAKTLGIDHSQLNQADLQEQTCAAALEQIRHLQNQLDKTCAPGCTPADAEKLREANHAMADENRRFQQERDEALAYAEVLSCAAEEIGIAWAALQDSNDGVYQDLIDCLKMHPQLAANKLKAELQYVGAMAAWVELKRMGMAQAGSKNVIQSLVIKIRKRAQEAGDE